jgi:hypothetical protein
MAGEVDPNQDNNQLLALIKRLRAGGMSQDEVMKLFGPQLGINNQPDQAALFQQYRPTWLQVEGIPDPMDIRKSIAKMVEDGTPEWQIKQDIINSIESGNAPANITSKDLFDLTSTLMSEKQSHTTALSQPSNQPYWQQIGLRDPNARFTPQDVFPFIGEMGGAIEQARPSYKTGAVGSGAKLPYDSAYDQSMDALGRMGARGVSQEAVSGKPAGFADAQSNMTIAQRNYNTAKQMLTTATPENRDSAKQALKDAEKNLNAMKSIFDKLNNQFKSSQKEKSQQRSSEMRGASNILKSAAGPKVGLDRRKETLDAAKAAYEKDPGNDFKYNQYLSAQTNYTNFLEKNQSKIQEAQRIAAQGEDYKTVPDIAKQKYIGPAGGESTMARTYDPFAMLARKALETKGQKAIEKAGYTPFMVDLANYLQGLNVTKGK